MKYLFLAVAVAILFISKNVKAGVVTMGINNSFDDLFKKYGALTGIDWRILKRISWIESRVGTYKSVKRGLENPKDIKGSVSQDGLSWGIMQMTLSTAKDYDKYATEEKLNNAEYSIDLASRHLKFLKMRYFPSNVRDLIMSYNHGQGNQLRFIQKEKDGSLKESEFLAGRDYYKKYQSVQNSIA